MGFFDIIGTLGGQAKTGVSNVWDAGANTETGSKLLGLADWAAGSGFGKVDRNLCYPLNLNSPENRNRPALMLTLHDNREGLNNAYNIFLPMPAGIQFADSASYNNVELGGTGKIGLDALQAGDAKGAIESIASNLNREQIKDAAAILANKFSPKSAASAIGVYAGTTVNKNIVTTFGGVATRAYSYAYKLIADSQAEADTIRKMHSVFRVGLYPDSTNLGQDRPPNWTIKFIDLTTGQDLVYVPKVYECFLTSLGCSLNASTNLWREGNAPVEVDLSVSFIETKALTLKEIMQLEQTGFKKEIFTQTKTQYPSQVKKATRVSTSVPTSNNFGTPTAPPGGWEGSLPEFDLPSGPGGMDASLLPPLKS